ncbi:MAG TPA: glycosyltransferase family 87 protein [Abditibacteriaceae bacterium]
METSLSTELPSSGVARFLLSWRFLRPAAIAYLVAVSLLWVVLIAMWLGGKNGRDAQGDVLGPDFPAFYTAGWMLRHGEADKLYEAARQREIQQSFLPGMKGVSAYINPPHYALLMQPLSTLSYSTAFTVWTLFSLSCFVAGIMLLRTILPELQTQCGNWLMALALGFTPVYYALSAGQNTGFTLLLHTAILVALVKRRDFVAGFLIAAGLLKPQLFLPLLPLLVIARRPKALGAFAIGAAIVCFVTWRVVGLSVAQEWFATLSNAQHSEMARTYATNIIQQSYKMFSWQAFWRLLLGANGVASALGWLCALGVFAALCRWWRSAGHDLPLCYALAVCATIVMVPHVFLYDLALLVLPGLVLANRVLALPAERLVALRFTMLMIFVGVVLIDQAQWTRVQFMVPLLTVTALLAARLLLHNEDAAVAPLQASTV